MSATEAEAEGGEEEREEFVWLNQTPTTSITGTFEEIIYAGRLDSYEEQNNTSFGVVLSDVSVEDGELFVNQAKPDEGVTIVDEEEEKRATDYRVVDLDDDGTTTTEVSGETFVTDRSGASFESTGSIDEDTVIVWYNGMSGQVVGRALDFNGRPFAQYKPDGYLVKGLLQVADGWRTGNKGEMSRNGKAPRVARAPIAREDLLGEEITLELGRWNGGRMYEVHIFDADGEEVEMEYNEDADEILAEADYRLHLYHGDGWQDEPENAEKTPDDFDIQVSTGDDVDEEGLTSTQRAFAQSIVDAIEGTSLTPEEAFDAGLEGVMESNGVDGDVDDIRRAVYEGASHLDADDL